MKPNSIRFDHFIEAAVKHEKGEPLPPVPGIQGAIAAIKANLDRPRTIVPVQFPDDYFLTEIERDGKQIKIQVEIDAYRPPECDVWDVGPTDSDGIPTGAGPFEEEEKEPHLELGRAYTADAQMLDIQLTKEEQEGIELAYLQKKLGKEHPYFGR